MADSTALSGADTEGLEGLSGRELRVEGPRNVTYRLERPIGAGATAVTFYATRVAPDGLMPVVLKVVRPSFIAGYARQVHLVVQKEVVALGRLNEKVPPCPYVVRLLDSGLLELPAEVAATGPVGEAPWLALEYVHGGLEGTSVAERVAYSLALTGHALDAARAARVATCLGKGLDAVHGVGVIHRDVTPSNVLCRGFGETEVFMLADFGIARPAGLAATFGSLPVGTPGYMPLEQAGLDTTQLGPWSDVFGFAATLFYVLTGEDYFDVLSPFDGLAKARLPERKRLVDAAHLSPELRARGAVLVAVDELLARATSPRPSERPQSAGELARLLASLLANDRSQASMAGLRLAAGGTAPAVQVESWQWSVRHAPGGERIVRSVAWDGPSRCLAATATGLLFWDGTDWRACTTEGLPAAGGLRFVQRVAMGKWLLGGDDATLASYSTDGVNLVVTGPDRAVSYVAADGELDDLSVVIGAARGRPPALYASVGRRWLKPLPLTGMASVSGLGRLGDSRWLVSGRTREGRAALFVCEPLQWELTELPTEALGALLGCATQPDLGVGLVVGNGGSVLSLAGERLEVETIPEAPTLSCAAVDVQGRAWASAAGRLWCRAAPGTWRKVWDDPAWTPPLVSLFADVGVVTGVAADGAIVEGRRVG